MPLENDQERIIKNYIGQAIDAGGISYLFDIIANVCDTKAEESKLWKEGRWKAREYRSDARLCRSLAKRN